jgi:prevent-host-death family protein
MHWSIAEARQRFSDLVRAAATEPQPVFNRGRLVAAMVDAETYRRFMEWTEHQEKGSIAEAFDELRSLCADEEYSFEMPDRSDRPNPFLEEMG